MKSLVNPLFWFLLFQSATAWLMLRRCRCNGRGRRLLLVILLSTLVLGVFAMPLARWALEDSLQVEGPVELALTVTHIFVLGGGYQVGVTPDEDFLIEESQRRVLHGIAIWRRYPEANLVFSGASREYAGWRDDARDAELMAGVAMSRDVPVNAIILETHSGNTREHPVEALKLAGVTPSTPIGLVTSGWHMRRAKQEFCRYFSKVAVYPVSVVPRSMTWQDFMPNADALDVNTTLIREWVGVLWYEILDRFDGPLAGELSCVL